MKNVLLQQAIKLTKQYRKRKHWRYFVRVTAALVVFCTTYALILPAITMEKPVVCGLQEHAHTEKCYTEKTVWLMHCTLAADPETAVLHTHQEHCYTTAGALICQIVEKTGHTHEAGCYGAPECICQIPESDGHTHSEACTTGKVLTCTVPASEGHIHDSSCASTEQVTVCTMEENPGHTHSEECGGPESCLLPETDGHIHGDGCHETREVPCRLEENPGHAHDDTCYGIGTVSCEIPETSGHRHDAGCYGQQGPLICGQEERKVHDHDERCYDSRGNLTCSLPRTISHTHDATCVTDTGEKVSVLTCSQTVHLHSDECFAKDANSRLVFLCDTGEHRHGESCYGGENVLNCTIPEHIHDAACVVADLDLTADVETSEQWEAPLKDVYRTGRWPQDILSVAITQLDYPESVRNVILSGGALKGYTRYGAKYGAPYGDWDTLFVRFCLDYAWVTEFPVHEDRNQWMDLLEEEKLLRVPADYTPKPGDLVFLDQDQVADAPVEIPVEADLVGIVAEILPATEEDPVRLKFLAGDVNNKVDYVICPLEDITIAGYGEMYPEEPSVIAADVTELIYEGSDYSVVVTFGPEAKLPENVQLDVREIMPGTEEYQMYYRQSVATIRGDSESAETVAEDALTETEETTPAETDPEEEQELEVAFARFFDIHFVSDGTVLEPAAPVDIRILYEQPIEVPDRQKSVAVHFADSGIELLDAETGRDHNSYVESFSFTQNSFSVSGTVVYAQPRAAGDCYIWIDGTCGGMDVYDGALDYSVRVTAGEYFTLPVHDPNTSPTTYRFRLKGWYDILSGAYYTPGDSVEINGDTVFYADWIADTYNIGDYVEQIVNTVDTSEFVTVDVFDFNALFNTYSTKLDYETNTSSNKSTLSDSGHSEKWLHDSTSDLDFVFVDANGEDSRSLANPNGRNNRNTYTNGNYIFPGIMPADLNDKDTDLRLMNTLFDKNQPNVLGRHYLGTGNFLFQYDSNPESPNFGYYYYDSEKNAASYYQSENRFYVYNYLEHASSSKNKDFLPLNSPYANNPEGKAPSGDATNGYVYDTTVNKNLTTDNFFFGMKTNIHFYLPNDVGTYVDNNQNPGNLDTNGKPMVFNFSGDDDVWIYVDGVLVLDIGGIHQANSGSINFSTGEVIVDGKSLDTVGNDDDLTNLFASDGGLKEGGHDLTIYYLERGCGESNCSIYFNLAPRYGLSLTKQDYHTRENLDNVEFSVYLDKDLKTPANLWPTHEMAKADPDHENTQYVYTTEDGYLSFFGLVAGKTYYIAETKNPNANYSTTDNLIRVTLNNHGVDISEVTVLAGATGRTQGYELISHHLDEVNQVVNLVLTNQKNIDPDQTTKHVRVTKDWILSQEDPAEIPDTVTVYLEKDGVQYGHEMVLGPHNGWTYTWTGLPDDGSTYTIVEYPVAGFLPQQSSSGSTARTDTQTETIREINWLTVGVLEDSARYLLKVGNNYLARNGEQLTTTTVSLNEDGKLDPAETALWDVVAEAEGFRISNGNYAITLDGSKFTLKQIGTGNQILYYDGDGLFAMQGGTMYYLTVSGNNISAGASVYEVGLIKREEINVDVHHIRLTNVQLKSDETTFLNVTKTWNTESAYWDREVTMHLYRNGVDTGYAMIVNRNTEWKVTFEGLPLKDEKGNLYSYTVVEGPVDGYQAEYSKVTKVAGGTKTQWEIVKTMAQDNTYVFASSSGKALNASSATRLNSTNLTDPQNPSATQQWTLVSTSSGDKLLKNKSKNVYLRYSSNSLSLTDKESQASTVSLVNGQLAIKSGNTNYYLKLDNSVSADRNSGTTLKVYQMNTVTTADGYAVTVTNSPYVFFILPETGGPGTWLFTLLGFAMAAFATVAFRSGKKGGRYAR